MKWYYKVMAGITTGILTSPLFSATVGSDSGNEGNVIGNSLEQIANGFGEGSKAGISSMKYIIAFGMLVFLVIGIIAGATGGMMWYVKTRGNPQQPANWAIAGLWGLGGAIVAFAIWLFIYLVLKHYHLDVVQIWASV